MKHFRVTYPLFVLLLFLAAFAPGSPASAASGRVTKGDVEAILYAPTFGGGAIFLHKHPVPGFEDFPRAAITPLSSTNGKQYCTDDWHVLRIAFLNGVDNVSVLTKEQAITELEGLTITLTLDGLLLPVIQTPIRMLNAADQQRLDLPGPGFAFQAGSILSPTALSAGTHTAGIVSTDPVYGTFQDSSTFIVDPSGTGVCLQN